MSFTFHILQKLQIFQSREIDISTFWISENAEIEEQ